MPRPETRKALRASLDRSLAEVLDLIGDEGIPALKSRLDEFLAPIRADLEAMKLMDERAAGRAPFRLETAGVAARCLVTPNFHGGARVPKAMRNRYPEGREVLYELAEPWQGRDFVIWNAAAGTFRAWSRKLYAPKAGGKSPPASVLKKLRAIKVPRRALKTGLIRLNLAGGEARKGPASYMVTKGSPLYGGFDGTFDLDVEEALPQSYIATVIHHMGTKCGVAVEYKGKHVFVTWNGAFLLRERIMETEWGAKAERKRR